MKSLFKIGFAGLAIAFMAAAYNNRTLPLGAAAKQSGLKGSIKTEVMFQGATAEQHLTIKGTDLSANRKYTYDHSLTIIGDVPPNAHIKVTQGQLDVTGNVSAGAVLEAYLPRRQDTIVTREPEYTLIGKTLYVFDSVTTKSLVPREALTPTKGRAAIIIGGRVDPTAVLKTDGETSISRPTLAVKSQP